MGLGDPALRVGDRQCTQVHCETRSDADQMDTVLKNGVFAIGTLASRGPADGRRVAIRAECFARPSG
jgi:hypothetical protein